MRKFVILGVMAAALAVPAAAAWALINPNFAPPLLVQQSKLILALKFGKPDAKNISTATVVQVIKGDFKDKTIPVDLASGVQKEQTEEFVKRIDASGDVPALLFVGEFKEEGAAGAGETAQVNGFIHISGRWFDMYRDKAGAWETGRLDERMEGTWNGGSDMFRRCIDYILTTENADVPVAEGVTWGRKDKVADLKDTVGALLTVDLAGDGKLLSLLAISAGGDHLFTMKDKDKPLQDITAERGLKSKSKVAVWADLSGDGRVDLASWDGAALTLWLQGGDGKFTAQPVKTDALKAGCLSLSVLDVGAKGKPGLLAGTPAAPVLLVPNKDNGYDAKPLTAAAPAKDLGGAGQCLVADLDGDNVTDVLQLFEKGSLFFKGAGVATFAEPAKWAVSLGPLPAQATLGDFDQDGRLDVLIAGDEICKLYHNYGPGDLQDRMFASGEVDTHGTAGANGCCVCDVNNDGRQDIFIGFSATDARIFFNRGFRSFGQAWQLDPQKNLLLGEGAPGTQCGLIADVNGDGAQDMVLVVNGGLFTFLRTVDTETAMAVRVVLPPGGGFAGPLTVTGYAEKRALGAWNVVAGSEAAFFGRVEAGPIELRWKLPGQPEQKKEIILENKPVQLVIPVGAAAPSQPSH